MKTNYLEKLLQGVAVEWKPLGEVADVQNGYTPSKKNIDFWENGTIPWFRMEDIRKNGRVLTDSIQHITIKAVRSGKLFPANSIIMSTTATIGEHALIKKDFMCNQQLTVISIKENIKEYLCYKYLFYYAFELSDICKKNINPGGFVLVSPNKIKKLKIPIPCPDNPKKSLEIQKKIVDMLDTFTELTSELTVELTARKKQYEHYREKLLTFNDDVVEWKTLGEVCDYEQPTKYIVETKTYNDDFKIPVLTAGKTFILGYTNETNGIYQASINPVIIFDDFTTANKWVSFDFKVKSSAMKLITSSDEKKVLLKYIFYYLQILPSGLVDGDHKRQWISNYSNKKIPIPPLERQKEIVEKLDKFDTLTNSISEGLPKEIELRKKQYEYYREMLLNFPKPA